MSKLNLQPRDRRMLAIGAVAVTLWVVYLGAQGPMKKYQLAAKNVADARARLKTIRAVEASVTSERSGQEAFKKLVAARSPGFNLYVYLQELSQASLKDRVQNIKNVVTPAAGGAFYEVSLTLNGVSIGELVDFLHKVYASNNLIAVPRVDYIKLARDAKGLECRLTFVSPRA